MPTLIVLLLFGWPAGPMVSVPGFATREACELARPAEEQALRDLTSRPRMAVRSVCREIPAR